MRSQRCELEPSVLASDGTRGLHTSYLQSLNRDILLLISAMCDLPTKANLCTLRKAWRRDLQRLLFRRVEIYRRDQLSAFGRCVGYAEDDIEIGRLLRHVRCFTYHPPIQCSHSSRLDPESVLTQLSQIPLNTSDGTVLFPSLVGAKLELNLVVLSGNTSSGAAHQLGRTLQETNTVNECFLKSVKSLWLYKPRHNPGEDLATVRSKLSISCLTSVRISFSIVQRPASIFAWYFREHHALRTVTLEVGEYLRERYSTTPFAVGESGRITSPDVVRHSSNTLSAYAGSFVRPIEGFWRLWRSRQCWPELREIILRVGEDQCQEVIPSLRSSIALGATSDPEREWLEKMVFWQGGNKSKRSLMSESVDDGRAAAIK